jgi:carboxyl-terminal processing protease
MSLRHVVAVLFVYFGMQSQALAINCQQVRQLAAVYLKLHFTYKKFDDEISKRTLDMFIRSWDPGKLYFYQADINELKKKYETSVDDTVMAANCGLVDDIVKVFGKRFEERHKEVSRLIDMDHKFNVDEFMELDRKKIEYAQTSEELTERWRQRIKFQLLQLNRNLKDLKKSREKVKKRYTLDIKRHNEETLDKIYSRFLGAFAASLDPHSSYMSPDEHEDSRIQMRLSLEGIGAVLRSEDGFTVIQSIVAGGAASKNGRLKIGDKIIAVGQETGAPVDVVDMDLPDVVKLIRGPGGSKVNLTVTREESGKSRQMDVQIVREKVQLTNSAAKAKFVDVKISKSPNERPMKIAILELPSFYLDFDGQNRKQKDYRSSATDMIEQLNLINKRKADAVVVDLRTNGGGSLTESIKIAGLFFDQGPVVQIKETDGAVVPQLDTDDSTQFSGPLVVLISRQSASASEIFAGAIQDLERGLIVGDDHTYGKGTVQNLTEIGSKLGAVKVTISKFYRPSGSSNQLNGVASDVIIPSLVSELEIGEKYYDYALEWDKINPSKYPKFGQVKPYVETLKKRSSERTKVDPGYVELAKEITEWQKSKDKRTQVSLNEKEDKKSKAEEKEEELEVALGSDNEPRLEDDINMQEAVRIAADYARLLDKKSLEIAEIQGLKPKKKSAKKAAGDKKDPHKK